MFKIDYYLPLNLKIVILGTYIILNWKENTNKKWKGKSYVFSHYKKRNRRLNKLISEK